MADAGAPRVGARGGRDRFSWDDVRASADREHYLGHSVKATTGRWCRGKDVFWYAKATTTTASDDALAREIAETRAREAAAMGAALGTTVAIGETGRDDAAATTAATTTSDAARRRTREERRARKARRRERERRRRSRSGSRSRSRSRSDDDDDDDDDDYDDDDE